MIAVVQRVLEASVSVQAEGYRATIGPGLCVLLAVQRGDSVAHADWMARKLAKLRVFADEHRSMNRSVCDTGGEVLLVSQFTLAGDCVKGNRPSFDAAEAPEQARVLVSRVAHQLRTQHDLTVACGVFGATMQVSLVNDGPVTLILRTVEKTSPSL
ncbi:MAG: D-tyrosyl-tRNA(Tyr) deacylase [Planctomycetes bacterium]|nr:D-tyrosyl-tRNA(Tyr) deacylase [Planctomycetota bacterium]